jgi:hypothetical protein
MENNYYRTLNLDFELDTSHFEYIKTTIKDPLKKETLMVGPKFIDDQLRRFAVNCNCTVINMNYFYTPAGESRVIHSDSIKRDNTTHINFIFNGVGSKMKWWQLKDRTITGNINILPNGKTYYYFSADHCNLVAEKEIIEPTMVNVGSLHSVENYTENDRWAISYSLGDENKMPLQWNIAMERFSKYFALPNIKSI